MKRIKKVLLMFTLFVFGLPNLCVFNLVLAENSSPYDNVIKTAIGSPRTGAVGVSLESATSSSDDIITDKVWGELVNDQVKQVIWYAINIFIIIWIAMAFIGGYKIMTSNSEDSMKEWIRFVVFGILWVIIMVSANFLAEWLVWDGGIINTEFDDPDVKPSWIQLAQEMYEKIMYPFIKVALYLVMWALFFMMATKVITFVISTEETAKKKAWWIILRCLVWILIVMWSKQIVEAVMWKQNDVLKVVKEWSTEAVPVRIDDMWNPLLEFWSIPLIAQVINWVMWLTMFVIVVLIIIQGYRMFAKPDDPENRKRLKKTMLYIIIWVLVIWASYVISNLLVVNGFSESQI